MLCHKPQPWCKKLVAHCDVRQVSFVKVLFLFSFPLGIPVQFSFCLSICLPFWFGIIQLVTLGTKSTFTALNKVGFSGSLQLLLPDGYSRLLHCLCLCHEERCTVLTSWFCGQTDQDQCQVHHTILLACMLVFLPMGTQDAAEMSCTLPVVRCVPKNQCHRVQHRDHLQWQHRLR